MKTDDIIKVLKERQKKNERNWLQRKFGYWVMRPLFGNLTKCRRCPKVFRMKPKSTKKCPKCKVTHISG